MQIEKCFGEKKCKFNNYRHPRLDRVWSSEVIRCWLLPKAFPLALLISKTNSPLCPFPQSLDCVRKMWLALYLKTLRGVSLHNGIGRLFIRAKIKKVFCKELLTQIAQSPSVKIHKQWLQVCQSGALRGPFSLSRLIQENERKLAAKLESNCCHTEGPQSLSLSLCLSLVYPVISPVSTEPLGSNIIATGTFLLRYENKHPKQKWSICDEVYNNCVFSLKQ